MPGVVWALLFAYALMMAGTSMLVLLAGIIGTAIAPSSGLATLPIAMAVVGVATSTLPTGRLLQHFGRRRIFLGYGLIAIAGALTAAFSLHIASFGLFCIAAFVIGWTAAAGHQYRFAALEAVPAELGATATSTLLFGGILAAFIGPELAVIGRFLLNTEYAGSFVLLCLSYLAGIAMLLLYRDRGPVTQSVEGAGRSLPTILKAPTLQLAVGSAAISYAVMSFIMTATPISMHQHAGHSLEATKFVIQSHIAAMYLPSLIYPALAARFGTQGMMRIGVAVFVVCLFVALHDREIINYWLGLVLLGVGWNFLFLAGTNLLPNAYQPEERFRVQSFNDFIVFSIQAVVSLGSGLFLSQLGWNGLLIACFPLLLVFGLLMSYVRRA